MSYFVDTYLDTDICIFHRNIWNHYETEHTRTINHLEGWHAALNRTICRPHPNIFILIKELKNQQQNFELDILSQKKCYQSKNWKKIQNVRKQIKKCKGVVINNT